jgi:hypothetical protein
MTAERLMGDVEAAIVDAYQNNPHIWVDTAARAAVALVIESLAGKIFLHLNDHLVDMRPNEDDSISGFNDAWGIVSKIIDEARSLSPEHCGKDAP